MSHIFAVGSQVGEEKRCKLHEHESVYNCSSTCVCVCVYVYVSVDLLVLEDEVLPLLNVGHELWHGRLNQVHLIVNELSQTEVPGNALWL